MCIEDKLDPSVTTTYQSGHVMKPNNWKTVLSRQLKAQENMCEK